jgi:hypothetical protein
MTRIEIEDMVEQFMAAFDTELERRLWPVKAVPEADLPRTIEDRAALITMQGHIGSVRAAARAALSATPIERLREENARVVALEQENERLRDTLDVDRYRVAIGIEGVRKAVDARRWLGEAGRGPYAWDDERYQQEFGAAIEEIDASLEPLKKVAGDWSDCPTDPLRVAANRDKARAALTPSADDDTAASG